MRRYSALCCCDATAAGAVCLSLPQVVTAGPKQKFGHPINDMDTFFKECDRIGTRVVGIHAHVGSGILRTGMWSKLADTLLDMIDTYSATGLKHLRWVDLGGGIGIPYK